MQPFADSPLVPGSDTIYGGVWYSCNHIGHYYYLGPGSTNPAFHTGDDVLAPTQTETKQKPIYAVADGTILFARRVTGTTWGNIILQEVTMPDGSLVYIRYAHVENMLVAVGDTVARGQHIADVGNSFGRFVYHLHIDVSKTDRLKRYPWDWPGLDMARIKRDYVDPQQWIQEYHDMATEPNPDPVLVDVIATDNLNVRKEPSANSSKLGLIKAGTKVQIKQNVVQNGYAALATSGWVLASYLKSVPPTPTGDPVTYYVTATNGLRIRDTGSISGKQIGSLLFGVAVQVLDNYQSDEGYVKLVGRDGWVSYQYLSKTKPTTQTPPPPVVVPPASIKGFGPHFLNGQYDATVANKYPVVKVMDNPEALAIAHNINPNRILIHRRYNAAVDNVRAFVASCGGAAQAAQVWYNLYKADFEIAHFAYHEGPCEPGISDELFAFEYERVKLMAANGYKACVLNLGVGHTSDDLWKRSDVQKLAALVEKTGGAIGLHCYAEGVMSASSGSHYWRKDGTWSAPGDPLPTTITPEQSWLAMRIIRDRQVLAGLGYKPQFIATELGLDDCYGGDANGVYAPHGILVRGWRSCVGIWQAEGWLGGTDAGTFYKRQLQWWVDLTGLPGCVYAHGDSTQWHDIHGVFDTVGLL